jgi:choline-sulfatase
MWDQLMKAGADTPERQPIFAHDKRILEGTLEILREKSKEQNKKPWAICASFVLPHPPWKARSDLLAKYKGKGDLPFNWKGEGRDTCDRYIQHFYGNLMNLPESQIRYCREVYFGLIEEFDEHVGKILFELKNLDLEKDTIVFYFSDHGEMAGEHGLWGKSNLLESSIRVPLIIRWPGRFTASTRVNTPVSLIDLYPTFLDLANVKLPEPLSLSGNSLLPLLNNRSKEFGGTGVFGEFEGEGWNHPRAFLREGKFKYVYSHTAEEHLYDIDADPFEMSDLIFSPSHFEVKTRLQSKIMSFWDPVTIEKEVLRSQARRKIAFNKNICMDLGW